MKISMLVYDIPATLRNINPGALLRRRGVRANLSCWAVPNDVIPWVELNGWTERGVRWHVWEYAESEAEKILKFAAEELRKETEKALERAEKSAEASAERLSETGDLDAFDYAVERATDRAGEAIDDFVEAAAVFGLPVDIVPVVAARQRVAALKIQADSRASTFAKLVEEVRRTGSQLPVAEAPAWAAADMAEDVGVDAADMRAAFVDA